jgi:DNA repair photolyase
VTYREVVVKSALNRVKGMPFDWSLNPWVGCQHACAYCYARAYHAKKDRDIGHGFDREIDVKINLVELLRGELRRRPTGSLAIGTATDPYQPIEGKYRLTRRSLEALVDYPMPTSIVTKSTLVVRDIDVLRELDDRVDGELVVYFSVPTLDDEVWRKAEPGTPPPLQRIRALGMLREAGIDAAVLCAPVLPGLTDAEASLDRVARAASDAGATSLGWRPLKIDDEIRDYYFDFLATEFPVLVPRYTARYASGPHTSREYQRGLDEKLGRIRARYGFRERRRLKRPEPKEAEQLALAM